jgi:hypothetical protein
MKDMTEVSVEIILMLVCGSEYMEEFSQLPGVNSFKNSSLSMLISDT